MLAYQENRLPRAKFTTKLEKMCKKLDANPYQHFIFRDPIYRYRLLECSVGVKNLWVVGSYARGALDCGDLDIVVEFVRDKAVMPPSATLRKGLLGALPRVSVYTGTPEDNTSGVEFKEARLIWQVKHDWRTAIDSLLPIPEATHFSRAYDALPVSREQLRITAERATTLVAAQESGHIQWRFIETAALINESAPPKRSRWSHWLAHFESYSAKTVLQLIPGITGYLQGLDREPGLDLTPQYYAHKSFGYQGHYIHAGGGAVPIELLDTFEYHQLAIFLPRSTRWPGGVLVVERGPQHPLVKALQGSAGWALYYPAECAYSATTYVRGGLREARGMDLYATKKEALELCKVFSAAHIEAADDWPLAEPVRVEGATLLRLLSQADIVVGAIEVPLTESGRRCLKERSYKTPLTTKAVLKQLRRGGYLPLTSGA